ncbi:hypothetical protein ACFSKS_08730 [Pseudocitrobacter faecalis]
MDENNINLDDFQNQLELTLRQTGKPELQPEALEQNARNEGQMAQHQVNQGGDITQFIKGLADRNSATFEAADRQALKNIIMARTGKSDAEAEQMVNQAEQNYQAARQKYEELKKKLNKKRVKRLIKRLPLRRKRVGTVSLCLLLWALLLAQWGPWAIAANPESSQHHRFKYRLISKTGLRVGFCF